MITVDQAIFTSAKAPRHAGYQLTAISPGVSAIDARELVNWSPGQGALASPAGSLNFHPLPSGAYCVSRTFSLGTEPDGAGYRAWTHCLVASPQAFGQFANNPWALLRAADEAQLPTPDTTLPPRLPPLQLEGRAAAVDQPLLTRLVQAHGPQWLGALVQAALDHPCVAITGSASVAEWIAALMSCLPIECRPEFSFCTGLKFSPTRPFRVFGWPGASEEMHRLGHQCNVGVLDLTLSAPHPLRPLDGWARLVERVLSSGQIAFLAPQLSKRRFELTPADLPALGLQLLEDFEAGRLRGETPEESPPAGRPEVRSDLLQWAHASHRPPRMTGAAATEVRPAGPAKTLRPDSPEVQTRLEVLDDAVWEAVGGSAKALETLRLLWPRLRAELGDELLAESREQYLRYALSTWEQYMGAGGVRNPCQAVNALDVLCVLFDRV